MNKVEFKEKIFKESFEAGALSSEAKEYWFDQFCVETIENNKFVEFAKKCASKKYENDSREWQLAYTSILFGMGCFLTKQYWQQGMYTEDEVKSLINLAWATASAYGELTDQADCDSWFENNKKK